jgi:hypothetical protein
LANGKEYIKYKKLILKELVSNKDIFQLILNRTIYDINDSDIQTEVLKYITRYWFIPEFHQEEGTYITFDFGSMPEGQGNTNKMTYLGMNIFSHKNIMEVNFPAPYNTPTEYKEGIRTDQINSIVQEIFNGTYGFGTGTMKLYDENPRQINELYYGRMLIFKVSDISNYEQNISD